MPEQMKIEDFESVFRIMEQSFPNDEYRPFDEQRALLDDPRYTVYVHRSDRGTVDAFLAVWNLEGFAFLEHFAVSPTARGAGLGSTLLRELVSSLGCCVCLEVELPNTPMAERRIGFYKRAGFVYHDYPYLQPPISKGKMPIPLRLMTHGTLTPACTPEAIKAVLYREVYRVPNNDFEEDQKK